MNGATNGAVNGADARDDEVLAVVIGRAGSRGLPRKNVLPLAGIPMIAHTVRFARATPGIARTIVSTARPGHRPRRGP